MARLKKNLRAYVLMESVMAMVIVMLCFGIAMMIINNIVAGSRDKLKTIARIRLESQAIVIKKEKRFIDETISADDFRIEKQFHPWQNSGTVFQMELQAVAPDGKILARYDELFRKP